MFLTNHAPGPWHNCGGIVFSESDGVEIATVSIDHIKMYGNRQLIKAAPDLLEALELLLPLIKTQEQQLGYVTHHGNVARAAIAKAKGLLS